ncbi:MAG: DUF1428 family protein [Chloroflexus sp.]|uniref:DUF1428 family protein n=1 Tax=Chloroflexus sp. TaxID=1904827 RepID=UPI0030990DFD
MALFNVSNVGLIPLVLEPQHPVRARRILEGCSVPVLALGSQCTRRKNPVLSFVEWRDKATWDAGMTKVTDDPRMQFQNWHPASTVESSSPVVSLPC